MAIPGQATTRKDRSTPSAPPRKGLVGAIVGNGRSQDFEQARREWVFVEAVSCEDEGFQEHCPCGQKLEIANYILLNPFTSKSIQVGSSCIRRFVILNGADTIEQSADIFDRLIAAKQRDADLVKLFPEILKPKVRAGYLNEFRRRANDFLGTLDSKGIDETRWTALLNLLEIGSTDREVLTRLRDALFCPHKIPKVDTTVQLVAESEEKLRDELAWRRRKRQVATTLSRSELYNPETYVTRKNTKG